MKMMSDKSGSPNGGEIAFSQAKLESATENSRKDINASDMVETVNFCIACNLNTGNHSLQEKAPSLDLCEEISLFQMLLDVTRINIDDGSICDGCIEKLVSAFAFIQQVRKVRDSRKKFEVASEFSSHLQPYNQVNCLDLEEEMNVPLSIGDNMLLHEATDLIEIDEKPFYKELLKPRKESQSSCSDFVYEPNDSDSSEDRPNENLAKMRTRSHTKNKGRAEVPSRQDRFECDTCNESFACLKSLNRHSNVHEKNSTFPCKRCDRKFLGKDKLREHMKTHLKKAKNVYSRKVMKWFENSLYGRESGPALRACKLCDQNFCSISKLRHHMKSHVDSSMVNDEALVKLRDQLIISNTNDLDVAKAAIRNNVFHGQFSGYYDVVNKCGLELCLSDSDASDASNVDDSRRICSQYKCELCEELFKHKYEIYEHTLKQHRKSELPYQCSVCHLGFVSSKMHMAHEQSQCRNKEKKHKCTQCPARYMWLSNLEKHQCPGLGKSERVLRGNEKIDQSKCNRCNEDFLDAKDQKDHICSKVSTERLKHGKDIECCLCGERFARLAPLRVHLQKHRDGKHDVIFEKSRFIKKYYTKDADFDRDADIALKIFTDFANQKLDRFYSAIDESGQELDINDSETDDEQNAKSVYACELCRSPFKRRKDIYRHQVDKHTSDIEKSSNRCAVCKNSFVCPELLEHHQRTNCENDQKTYQCQNCCTRFMWQENLDKHTKLQHKKANASSSLTNAEGDPYKCRCDECGKTYAWRKDLLRHLRTHLCGKNRNQCTVCQRVYARKDNLLAHMKSHETAEASGGQTRRYKAEGIPESLCKPHGNKTIKCKLCDSQHGRLVDLRAHLICHQNNVSLDDLGENLREIFEQFYPEQPKLEVWDEAALVERIKSDLGNQQFERFYSILSEFGNELTLDSSETDTEDEFDNFGARGEKASSSSPGKYVCHICKLVFNRKFQAFQHQTDKHDWESLSLSCRYCCCRFIDKKLLDWHLKEQCENQQKVYLCKKCPMQFRWKENLKHHLLVLHPAKTEGMPTVLHKTSTPSFKCLFCPSSFFKEQGLHMHIMRHGIFASHLPAAESILKAMLSENGLKKVICRGCNEQFSSIAALRKHFEAPSPCAESPAPKYSITNALGFEMDINDSETENEEDTARHYTCQLCNSAQFKRKYEIARHQHSNYAYELLPLKCDKCIFRTVSADILDYHKRTQCENTEKLNQCDVCGFKFMWPENLRTHKKLLHGGLEALENSSIFQCTQCPRRYNRKDRLSAHIKKMHSTPATLETQRGYLHPTPKRKEVTTYQCSQCPQKYGRKPRLSAHIRKVHSTHTEEPPEKAATSKGEEDSSEKKYLCALCGRSMTSATSLKVHMRRHTGEKPFKCDSCDKAFPRSTDLRIHRRTHTGEKPFACTVCGKAFSRSHRLMLHSRVHSGEKPYKCTYSNCERSFAQANDLTLHIRRHTGEKPYVCGICNERFIQGTALRNHRNLKGHFEPEKPRPSLLLQTS